MEPNSFDLICLCTCRVHAAFSLPELVFGLNWCVPTWCHRHHRHPSSAFFIHKWYQLVQTIPSSFPATPNRFIWPMIRYGSYVFRKWSKRCVSIAVCTTICSRFIYHDGEKPLSRPPNEEDLAQCLVLRDLFSWTNKSWPAMLPRYRNNLVLAVCSHFQITRLPIVSER